MDPALNMNSGIGFRVCIGHLRPTDVALTFVEYTPLSDDFYQDTPDTASEGARDSQRPTPAAGDYFAYGSFQNLSDPTDADSKSIFVTGKEPEDLEDTAYGIEVQPGKSIDLASLVGMSGHVKVPKVWVYAVDTLASPALLVPWQFVTGVGRDKG